MLDSTTKKRIDNCRDILVGKVPDPKSQIEQITIALIYKFMDDMDREAIELGGKRQFFGKDYEKYAWPELFQKDLSGENRVKLYAEAIEKMEENPGIPQLFRDIFKNAYLPYRDPETLREFLKYINEFTYDHSEKLGDAFEYLLSVLGSQGDAGQFRTPRHIIDFMVELLAPQKNEVILDPACGTAGFLISAYKYILKNNSTNFNATTDAPAFMQHYSNEGIKHFRGDKLTPDQRKKLANNLNGYDISPDMVRLSLVNLYLHGLPEPHIYEYDTLTNEERWNEKADVILANPPFMTPKGGIRPHKKFGVQANKAEVLFTDYIAEHLNSNGRAGIVVPNGIVATSQTAYKQLRKMLVQESLIAVISLPAGVFQPYSGVKTSILILDKRLAKKSQHILFLKIENDGFDLGAQRKEINKNDLPLALQTLETFKDCLSNDRAFEDLPSLATLVEKQTIIENKDIGLSAERYFKHVASLSEFEYRPIGDLFLEIKNGKNVEQFDNVGKYRVSRIQTIANGTVDLNKTKWTNDEVNQSDFLEVGDILLSHINSIEHLAKSAIFKIANEKVVHGINLLKFKANRELIIPEYAAMIFKSRSFINDAKVFAKKAVNQASIATSDLRTVEIPLPPIEIQKQIVAEIEGYQKIIDGAKQVVNNYKPTFTINPDWEMVELGEVCEVNPKKSELKELDGNLKVTFVPMADLNENEISFIPKEEKLLSEVITGYTYFADNDVLFAKVTPCFENGKAGIAKDLKNKIGFGSSEFFVLRANEKALPIWLYLNIKSLKFSVEGKSQMSGTSGLQRIPREFVTTYQIPLPSLTEQQTIAKAIQEEMQLVKSNKRIIEIFEQKIKYRIAKVWGEEKSEENVYPEVEIPLGMAAEG